MSYNLTREQEYDYITRAQNGDKRAANEFVAMHTAYVKWSIVNQFGRRDDHDMDDLIAWGMVGITKALQRFDVTRGYRFSTLAGHWVFQYVSRALREMNGLSKNSDEDNINRRRDEVIRRLSNGEPANDIGTEFGISGDRVKAFVLRTAPKVQFDKLSETQHASCNPESAIIESDERRYLLGIVNEALESLPYRSRQIVKRYYDGETFDEIAKSMNINRARVQYIMHRDLAAVRKRAQRRVKSAA